MKKLLASLFVFIWASHFAQAPQKINYQGIARDAGGVPISTLTSIGLEFKISDGANTIVHSEIQPAVPVNSLGLFSTQIGKITPITSTISWQNGPYTLSVSIDMGVGLTFLGSQQLVSVPYALYAEKSGNGSLPTGTLTGQTMHWVQPNGWQVDDHLFNDGVHIEIGINSANKQNKLLVNSSSVTDSSAIAAMKVNAKGHDAAIRGVGVGSTVSNTNNIGQTAIYGGDFISVNNLDGAAIGLSGTGASVGYAYGVTGVAMPTSSTAYGIGLYGGVYNSSVTTRAFAAWLQGKVMFTDTLQFSNTYSNTPVNSVLTFTNGGYAVWAPGGGGAPTTSVFAGNSNITVSGVAPSYTVSSSPSLSLISNSLSISNGNTILLPPPVNTTITGSGIAVVTPTTGNNFNVAVAAPTLQGSGGTSVSGSYPNFTISSPTIAPVITPTIVGTGIAAVTPTTGNNFSVSVVAPSFTGAGSTSVSGSYPNYTISSATTTPSWFLTGNAGTTPSVNFIGTLDNNPFAFRANNLKAGLLDPVALNSFFGVQAGNSSTGSSNSALGYRALFSNTNGSGNTAIGYQAGNSNISGTGNVFLGYQAGFSETGSNKLYIANSNANPPLIFGDFSTGMIGLGTNAPTIGKLQIASTSTATGLTSSIYSDIVGNSSGSYYGHYARVEGASTGAVLGLRGFAVGAGSGDKTGLEGYAIGSAAGVMNRGVNAYAGGPGLNYGIFATATGGATNWAGYFSSGNVHIQNNLGLGTTAPAARLDVNGTALISGANTNELNRTQTGDANLVPIAYANVNSDGTINAAGTTSNVTLASHNANSGLYYFNVSSESIFYLSNVVVATLVGVSGEISWASAGGQLAIITYNSSGAQTDKPFSFVIYKK